MIFKRRRKIDNVELPSLYCDDPLCGCHDADRVNRIEFAINSLAAVPTNPMVEKLFEPESIAGEIAYYEQCIEECKARLEAMSVPTDVSDIFAPMVDDELYTVIGDPAEYSRSDDELVAMARVLFNGEPYTVIGRSTDSIDPDTDKHFVYVHLYDDFRFSVGNAIYAERP